MDFIKYVRWFIYILIAVMLTCFFFTVGPFCLYNGDDWSYVSSFRSAVPSLAQWNPGRVFGETIQPLAGLFTAWFVFPFTGDYLLATRITSALALSSAILFIIALLEFTFNRIGFSRAISFFSAMLFLVLSFLIFRTTNSSYLFFPGSVTLLYFYIYPNIGNSSLVLMFIYFYYQLTKNSNFIFNPGIKYPYAGLLVLTIYLLQFSITVASLISAGFASFLLLYLFIRQKGDNVADKFKLFKRSASPAIYLLLLTVMLWIVAQSFEVLGERYYWWSKMKWNWDEALMNFATLLKSHRRLLYIISGIFPLLALSVSVYDRFKSRSCFTEDDSLIDFIPLFGIILCSSAVSLIFVFLTGPSSPWYMSQIWFTYGVFFYEILLTVISVAWLLKRLPRTWLCAPLIIYILIIEVFNQQTTWKIAWGEQKNVVQAWIDKMKIADQEGRDTVRIELDTLDFPTSSIWAEGLARTLYLHGVIKKPLRIERVKRPKTGQ